MLFKEPVSGRFFYLLKAELWLKFNRLQIMAFQAFIVVYLSKSNLCVFVFYYSF